MARTSLWDTMDLVQHRVIPHLDKITGERRYFEYPWWSRDPGEWSCYAVLDVLPEIMMAFRGSGPPVVITEFVRSRPLEGRFQIRIDPGSADVYSFITMLWGSKLEKFVGSEGLGIPEQWPFIWPLTQGEFNHMISEYRGILGEYAVLDKTTKHIETDNFQALMWEIKKAVEVHFDSLESVWGTVLMVAEDQAAGSQ